VVFPLGPIVAEETLEQQRVGMVKVVDVPLQFVLPLPLELTKVTREQHGVGIVHVVHMSFELVPLFGSVVTEVALEERRLDLVEVDDVPSDLVLLLCLVVALRTFKQLLGWARFLRLQKIYGVYNYYLWSFLRNLAKL
jgi:hypothetical protein